MKLTIFLFFRIVNIRKNRVEHKILKRVFCKYNFTLKQFDGTSNKLEDCSYKFPGIFSFSHFYIGRAQKKRVTDCSYRPTFNIKSHETPHKHIFGSKRNNNSMQIRKPQRSCK